MDALSRDIVRRKLEIRGDPPAHPSFGEVWRDLVESGRRDVLSEADVRRMYQRAIHHGLVSIRVTDELVTPEALGEDPELSRELTDYGREHLQSVDFQASVLDSGPIDGSAELGDRLQELLGWTAGADWLSRELAARDQLAVAGGRAVVAAVDGIMNARGFSGVSVFALTGSSEQGTGRIAGASLDADSVVRRIMSDAGDERRPDQVRYATLPLALDPAVMQRDNPKGVLRRISGHIHHEWWRTQRPDFTILGIARVSRKLTPNHPLFVSRNPFIERQIAELDDLLLRHEDDGLIIGEMAHQLWVAEPAAGPIADEASELCARINERMVAPTLTSLSIGRRLVVIGGGDHKEEVIRSLLDERSGLCVPTNLYTDSGTARFILDSSR